MASPPQSDAFKKAVVDSKKLTAKPSNDELLDLYGRFLHHHPFPLFPSLSPLSPLP